MLGENMFIVNNKNFLCSYNIETWFFVFYRIVAWALNGLRIRSSPSEVFGGVRRCSEVFGGLRHATLLTKSVLYRCFPVNFKKFLRTRLFTEPLWWLLLWVWPTGLLTGNFEQVSQITKLDLLLYSEYFQSNAIC